MGAIKDKFDSVYRDYAIDGVKASGPYNPEKSEQRAIGPLIETAVANAGLGSLIDVVYATRAELDADLAHDPDSVALVYADADDANNDLYTKTGASGAGAWTLTSALHDIISNLVSPFLPETSVLADYINGASLFQTIGRPVDPVDGSGLTAGTYVFGQPAKYAGGIYQVRVFGRGNGTVRIQSFTVDGDDKVPVAGSVPVEIAVTNEGLQTFLVDPGIEAGEYLGFYAPNGVIALKTGTTGDSNGYWNIAGVDATETGFTKAALNPNNQIQIGFDIRQPFATADRILGLDDTTTTRIPLVFNNETLLPSPTVSVFGGAIALASPDIGYRVPVDQIGNGSFINFFAPLHDAEFAKYNGKKVRLEIVFETENYVQRAYGGSMVGTAAATSQLLSYDYSYDADRNRLVWTFDFIPVWTAGDTSQNLKFYLQAGTIAAAASEIRITVVDQFWTPLEAVDPQPELLVMMREVIRQERVRRQVSEGVQYTVVTANSDAASGADFTGLNAIQDAIDSIKDASADNQYEVRVSGRFVPNQTAHYTKVVGVGAGAINAFIAMKSHVHVVGDDTAQIEASVPGATPDKTIYDAVRHDADARFDGIYVHCVNVRYSTHFEGSGATPNRNRRMNRVHLKTSASGGGAALGYGGSSGELSQFVDCRFEAGNGSAVYVHDSGSFSRPMRLEFLRCVFDTLDITPDPDIDRAFQLQSLGSGLVSHIALTACYIASGAPVSFLDAWVGAATADHNGWRVSAPDHEPRAVQTSTLRATVLRIVSSTTGASSAIVADETSSAFDVIFGKSSVTDEYEGPLWFTHKHGYQRKAGGVGLTGQALSGLDLDERPTHAGTAPAGYYDTSLGKRLGDCSTVNKTLVVNVDGVNRTVTFDKNYDGTASNVAPTYSNAAILAEINTALSGFATASLVALGRYHYPVFKGNEVRSNSDSTAILKGMGVVFTASRGARIATSADTRIDGVALDDAAPGKLFRLITCGEIFTQNSGEWFALREVASVAHAVGTKLGISAANPGVFDPAAANKVLRIVATNVAAFL